MYAVCAALIQRQATNYRLRLGTRGATLDAPRSGPVKGKQVSTDETRPKESPSGEQQNTSTEPLSPRDGSVFRPDIDKILLSEQLMPLIEPLCQHHQETLSKADHKTCPMCEWLAANHNSRVTELERELAAERQRTDKL